MTRNEIKIGDKVRIKAHPSVNPDYVGRICEVASVNEGAYITFKDCDSYWHPEVLELIEPLDRKAAFLAELQALLRKYDAEICGGLSDISEEDVVFILVDNKDKVKYLNGTSDTYAHINAENIMDFDKE